MKKKKKKVRHGYTRKFTLSSFTFPIQSFRSSLPFYEASVFYPFQAFLHGQKRQFSSTSSLHTDSFYEQMHSLRWRAELLHFSPLVHASRAFFFFSRFIISKEMLYSRWNCIESLPRKVFLRSAMTTFMMDRIVDTESTDYALSNFYISRKILFRSNRSNHRYKYYFFFFSFYFPLPLFLFSSFFSFLFYFFSFFEQRAFKTREQEKV